MAQRLKHFWIRVYRIAVMPDYVMGDASLPTAALADEPVAVRYPKPARGETNS